MKLKKALVLALLLGLAACAAKRSISPSSSSNGTPRSATGDFTSVVADGFASVHIAVGKAGDRSVAVSCEDGDTSRIETHVDGDALIIESKTKTFEFRAPACNVDVALPTLEGLEQRGSGAVIVRGRGVGLSRIGVHGSGDADIDAAQATRVDMKLSGSGSLKLRELAAQKAFVELAGSGAIKVAGKAESIDVKSKGSGDIDARSLESERAHLEARGSSSTKLFASRRIEVDMSGSGDAVIAGRPAERESNIRGSGTVRYER